MVHGCSNKMMLLKTKYFREEVEYRLTRFCSLSTLSDPSDIFCTGADQPKQNLQAVRGGPRGPRLRPKRVECEDQYVPN